jgi:hypothetical protein
MTTLVVEIWYKGTTPLDTTTFTAETRHNNIDDNYDVEGLVSSFTWQGLTCMLFLNF